MIIVIVQASEADTRNAVNRLMRRFGKKLRPGVWECGLSSSRAGKLSETLEGLLTKGCWARIIPVCNNCRRNQRIWGESEPDVPPAWIIDSDGAHFRQSTKLLSPRSRRPE